MNIHGSPLKMEPYAESAWIACHNKVPVLSLMVGTVDECSLEEPKFSLKRVRITPMKSDAARLVSTIYGLGGVFQIQAYDGKLSITTLKIRKSNLLSCTTVHALLNACYLRRIN